MYDFGAGFAIPRWWFVDTFSSMINGNFTGCLIGHLYGVFLLAHYSNCMLLWGGFATDYGDYWDFSFARCARGFFFRHRVFGVIGVAGVFFSGCMLHRFSMDAGLGKTPMNSVSS
jgi:hypothetical protein